MIDQLLSYEKCDISIQIIFLQKRKDQYPLQRDAILNLIEYGCSILKK